MIYYDPADPTEKPIPIESDFISHVDGQPCRDVTCPCHAEQYIEVALSNYATAQYDRHDKTVTIVRIADPWYTALIVLSPDETYRLLALLSAEMPAEHTL